MAEGFLKGIWGKPAQQGTGVMGIWGTIKNLPNTMFKTITSPLKIISILIVGSILLILYKGYKKK
ncbi:hypothetical protein KAU33_14280 [Candidatus Dependentiae bacterium]|nr:hypothetical protein [Candidatus Dependentiae bacterium]